jgi:hypothetical protein
MRMFPLAKIPYLCDHNGMKDLVLYHRVYYHISRFPATHTPAIREIHLPDESFDIDEQLDRFANMPTQPA